MKQTGLQFLCCDQTEIISKITENIVTPRTADSEKHFFAGMFVEEPELEPDNINSIREALNFKKTEEINSEIRMFAQLISTESFAKAHLSSNQFWKDNKINYPHLYTISYVKFNQRIKCLYRKIF